MSAFDIWIKNMGKFLLMMALGIGLGEAVVKSPIWLLPYLILGIVIVGWGWYSYGVAKLEAKRAKQEAEHEAEMEKLNKRPRRTVF